MTTHDDGGSAFPRAPFEFTDISSGLRWSEKEQRGMTLRQWYAGLAMQGILASGQAVQDGTTKGYATLAVQQADVLIEELKK